jgi:hypothetical protein
MMRRIEARISSIEGSWTLAACVISDSRSSTRSHHVVLHQRDGICRFQVRAAGDFTAQPHSSPDQASLDAICASPPPLVQEQRSSTASELLATRIAPLPKQRLCHGVQRLQAKHRMTPWFFQYFNCTWRLKRDDTHDASAPEHVCSGDCVTRLGIMP